MELTFDASPGDQLYIMVHGMQPASEGCIVSVNRAKADAILGNLGQQMKRLVKATEVPDA